MGLKVIISVKADDPNKIATIARSIIASKTGKSPRIHIVNTPNMLDNNQQGQYHSIRRKLGAP